jgi:hypothetical protein
MAEQLEFRLFKRKFRYSRFLVRVSERLNYSSLCAFPLNTFRTHSILARDPVCSSIALILLRKQNIMSVVFPTVVDVCGRFCRQTAVAAIDTVAMTRYRNWADVELRVSQSARCAPQETICTTKPLSTDCNCVGTFWLVEVGLLNFWRERYNKLRRFKVLVKEPTECPSRSALPRERNGKDSCFGGV